MILDKYPSRRQRMKRGEFTIRFSLLAHWARKFQTPRDGSTVCFLRTAQKMIGLFATVRELYTLHATHGSDCLHYSCLAFAEWYPPTASQACFGFRQMF
jgi:hypothetical protein